MRNLTKGEFYSRINFYLKRAGCLYFEIKINIKGFFFFFFYRKNGKNFGKIKKNNIGGKN